MRHLGFLFELQEQLESIPMDVLDRINRRGGLEVSSHVDVLTHPSDHTVYDPLPFTPDAFPFDFTAEQQDNPNIGLCIDAKGISKIDDSTQLDVEKTERINDILRTSNHYKKIWIIAPRTCIKELRRNIQASFPNVVVLPHHEVLCMTTMNSLYLENGEPVLVPGGSGDVIPVLLEFDQVRSFHDNGGNHIIITDMSLTPDNSFRNLLLMHKHLKSPITCQVSDAPVVEECAVLCEHEGIPKLIENFKMCFSPGVIARPHIRSTGTYVIDASYDFSKIHWRWHRRQFTKGNALIVKYQRYMDDVVEQVPASFSFESHMADVTAP